MPREQLIGSAAKLLEVPAASVVEAIGLELAEEVVIADMIEEMPCIFLASLHRTEREIGERLRALAAEPIPWPAMNAAAAIPWVSRKTGLVLAESQVEAVRVALRSKALVITGGPGVGKTTLLRSILLILQAKQVEIALCAPTGRAAKRLSESTGVEARTIHRLLDAPAEGRVGGQPSTGGCAAIGQPLQAEERRAGQALGQLLREPGLADAERPGDVGDRPDHPQLEPLTAPRPGKIEGDDQHGGWLGQASELSGRRRLAPGDIASQHPDLLHSGCQLTELSLEPCLVRRQRGLQVSSVARQNPFHLSEAEAQRAQTHDLGRAGHLVRTVGPPAGHGADRREKAAFLVEPQGLRLHAELLSGLRGIQISSGSIHDSLRSRLPLVSSGLPQGPGQQETW